MDDNTSFGYWVRRQRKALDLTQAELARRFLPNDRRSMRALFVRLL